MHCGDDEAQAPSVGGKHIKVSRGVCQIYTYSSNKSAGMKNCANMTPFMRAVAQLGQTYNISVVDVPVSTTLSTADVIIRIDVSAICGSSLHIYRQTYGCSNAPILYNEAIGHVAEVGEGVQFLKLGDSAVNPDSPAIPPESQTNSRHP